MKSVLPLTVCLLFGCSNGQQLGNPWLGFGSSDLLMSFRYPFQGPGGPFLPRAPAEPMGCGRRIGQGCAYRMRQEDRLRMRAERTRQHELRPWNICGSVQHMPVCQGAERNLRRNVG
ncbi:uncharacterized protein LOC125039746 [Penaeus chinensis]|uniref:uncharacterized protein LOC125039746 n=1 Tax=Penaeus chinensis TaxID=139456 RepID=UPI001FB7C055|nr:uncharacterized protein LOC125039746 [Penaeus chinensis]